MAVEIEARGPRRLARGWWRLTGGDLRGGGGRPHLGPASRGVAAISLLAAGALGACGGEELPPLSTPQAGFAEPRVVEADGVPLLEHAVVSDLEADVLLTLVRTGFLSR